MSTNFDDQDGSAVATTLPGPQPGPQLRTPDPEPKVIWTVLATLFFGIFGAIVAAVQSSKASRLGYSASKAWIAFGITVLVSIALEIAALLVFIGVIVVASGSTGFPSFKPVFPSFRTDWSLVVYLLVIAVMLVFFAVAIAGTGHAGAAQSSRGSRPESGVGSPGRSSVATSSVTREAGRAAGESSASMLDRRDVNQGVPDYGHS